MKKRHLYTILGGMLCSLTAAAQGELAADTTVNRTVVVEQNYLPEVADATKINVLPSVEQPSVEKSPVAYANQPAPSVEIPAGKMAVIGTERPARRIGTGFLRAGYGNRGNLDAAASFLFRLSARDRLSLGVLSKGMKGDVPMITQKDGLWDAFDYQTQANVGYSHLFRKVEFNLAGNVNVRHFNYMPDMAMGINQNFLSGSAHVGVQSSDAMEQVRFKAETNMMLYRRRLTLVDDKTREMRVKTAAEVSGSISDASTVTVGVEMNNLIYNQPKLEGMPRFESRTTLDLNPSYEYNNNGKMVRIGANVDLSMGAGKAFRISPDVEAQLTFANSYVLFLNATGGRKLSDFRRLENENPLITENPRITDNTRLVDTYELVNASLGLKASPANGLWFLLAGGYQYLQDDLYTDCDVEMPECQGCPNLYDYYARHTDAYNFFAQVRLSYAFKQFVDFAAGFEYRKWNAKSDFGYLYLSQRPNYKLDVQLGIRPIASLHVHVGYNYLVRCEELIPPYGTASKQLNDLYLSASYDVLRWLSVYTRMNNLLNERGCVIPFVPQQGFNFVVGLRCQF